jgi:release factor glutamine methyltransferase
VLHGHDYDVRRANEHPSDKIDNSVAGDRAALAIARATARLAAAGIASPRVDAELLVAHVLGVPRSRLLLAGELDASQAARFDELVAARVRRVPVQHLVGSAGFRHLELAVGPGVFIPRPETELLAGWGIEAALGLAAAAGQPAGREGGDPAAGRADGGGPPAGRPEPLVVDLCSGSGAIALSVAHEAPGARVYAVERDPVALRWLRRNAADRAAAGDRPIEVVAGDVTDPGLLAQLRGAVDVVLCNPPYVPEAVDVPPEVTADPAQAVFGGPDGLAVIGPVIALAGELLRPGGVVGIEHDDGGAEAVHDLLVRDGRFAEIIGHPDLVGRPRFASAARLHGRLPT